MAAQNRQIETIAWTSLDRQKYIEQLKKEVFDLVIIGGGITGAGLAREAALRGIKTALIDKNDFAYGTSSKSSKLAHGGFRYLSQYEFKLVRESTTERNWLRNHFTHNVRPAIFNSCIFEKDELDPAKMKFGIRLYDLISNFGSQFKQFGKHKFLSREEAVIEQPQLDHSELLMIGQFYDTIIDDGRLTLETIKESIALGDVVPVNYVEALKFQESEGVITAVEVHDSIGNEDFQIQGHQFVNATGIWTDNLLEKGHSPVIRPTKGVHVQVPQARLGNIGCIGINSIDDARFFFILERDGINVIGTTDTDYPLQENGHPNEDINLPYCTKEDCDYLFRTVNHAFPNAHLTYDDIISTYAGIRPLVMEEGKDESQVSRKHVLIDSPNGLTTICGGKLTTFRLMAEETLYHIIFEKQGFGRRFPKKQVKSGFSKQPFLVSLSSKDWDAFLKSAHSSLDHKILKHLYQQYGQGAKEIVKMVQQQSSMGTRLLSDHPFIQAEIYYIMAHESVVHLPDVLLRRTEISMRVKHTRQHDIAQKVADIMQEVLKWDKATKSFELSNYLAHIARTIWF
ncbi:MAG: glycerol-3-phosphate dehydrogenase/oxidase [Promethearchaeota archaeon]